MNKEELLLNLTKYGINASEKECDELFDLMDSTLKMNENFNLTAIKDENEFLEKMILDSALATINISLKDKKVIDVGTGAGFPGMVIYILNKDINLTLLDSTAKKINYLKEYCLSKNYKVNTVTARAEDYAKKNREVFDVAYARAVSALPILLELIIPLLKVNGLFAALKGPGYLQEIDDSKKAFSKLGCHVDKVQSFTLTSGEERHIILVKKDKETNKKYPRDYSEIKKCPL